MVKRRHKPISDSEIVTFAHRIRQQKVGPKQRLPLTVFPIRINGRSCACLPLAGCIWSKRTKGHEAGQMGARQHRQAD
jgi:hypothetical protein